MTQLPPGAPASSKEALDRVNAVVNPTVDDLKLMVFLEGLGEASYHALAAAAPNEAIRRALEVNGREERAHAFRIAKAVELLSGEIVGVPTPEENPYKSNLAGAKVDRALLEMLIGAEEGGGALYETWAAHLDTINAEAAELFRQSARDEVRHSARFKEALAQLDD
jgi:rubrerythrin